MIIPEGYYQTKESTDMRREADSDSDEMREEPTEIYEPPPSYTPRAEQYAPTAFSHPPPRRAATAPSGLTSATNYQFISKTHGAIKGQWTIDPLRHIPASLLPALRRGESAMTRPNLRLETMHGSINGDVTLVSSSPSQNSKRVKAILYAKTTHGNIEFKLDDAPGSETPRLPVELVLEACNGRVNVWLPRSFRGFITSTTLAGGTTLSDGINDAGHLIETGATAKLFVGDFTEDADDLEFNEDEEGAAPEWKGDRLAITTMHGEVKIQYVDEPQRRRGLKIRGHTYNPGPTIYHGLNPFGAFMPGTGGQGLPGFGQGFPFGGMGMPGFPQRSRGHTSGFMSNWR